MQPFFERMRTDRHLQVLALIFLAGLGFRLWGVTQPLLDFHSWRQTLTATVAKNFYTGGMNLFAPATNWAVEYYEFEFPVYTYLVALLYKVLGFHDFLGRLVAIAFALGSMVLLYRLIRRYFDKNAAAFATALFAVLPLAVYYTRTFMPESALLFFSIASLYFFTRWLDGGSWTIFFLAAGATALTFLIKLPALFMGGPILFLAWLRFGGRMVLKPEFYLFLVLIFVPSILWYGHMGALHAAAHDGESIWLDNDKLGNREVLLDYRFYKLILWTRLGEKMFAFTGIFFVICGMIARMQRKEQYLFHVWFFSVCVYFLLAAVGNKVHEYYQLPIIPPGCALAGKFLADFFAARPAPLQWKTDWKLWAVVLMIVFIPAHSIYKLDKRLRYNTNYIDIGNIIQQHTQKDELLLIQDIQPDRPQTFYFSDRKGWTLGMKPDLTPEAIQTYVEQGAAYFGWVQFDMERSNPALLEYLSGNHERVTADPRVTLFALGNPMAQNR